MVCLAALVVFGVLGIFSATHREMAKEALRCVFRRIRLHPCDPTFTQKVKTKLVWRLGRRNDRLARFLNQRFELFSWAFVLALLASLILSGYGLFNLAKYGSCQPHSNQCVFRPGVVECGGSQCEVSCDCDEVGCDPDDFSACEGDCDCVKNVCGGE
jgi:hypothetical protein